MKFRQTPSVLLTFLIFLTPPFFSTSSLAASSLNLSKSLPHYSEEMEFYYLHPRPAMLPDLLKNFSQNGVLAQNEKQLMVAAFFAALALNQKIDLEKFVPLAKNLGRYASRTIAWSAHLARHKNESQIVSTLLDARDESLRRQIAHSPAPLSKWNIRDEPSIVRMYWGAYLATGELAWLDQIIDAALFYGRMKARGLWHEPGVAVGQGAASSLYEFAPHHKAIRDRLKYFLDHSSGTDFNTLKMMLGKTSQYGF